MFRSFLIFWLFAVSVLSGAPVISEFMASNQSGLQDGDGDFSDWLEIHNPDAVAVDLNGYYLTDNASSLKKWRFPATVIPAGGYKVIFASGKNRAVSGAELHTNFSLSAGGEYLGLIAADGLTPVSAYSPQFPSQSQDISYGIPSQVVQSTLIAPEATARWIVPSSSGNPASIWRNLGFDHSAWTQTAMGIGYDRNLSGVNFLPEIGAAGNTESAMYSIRSSCYLRIPFTVADPAGVFSLKLRLKYDDGFVAYLNGQPLTSNGVALSRNAPTNLLWNSGATTTHNDLEAMEFVEFDVSTSLGLLATDNVLAFQALNNGSGSSDFLFKAQLIAETIDPGASSAPGYFTTATPGARNGGPGTLVIPQKVAFSATPGTFINNFNLTLSGATAGQAIRYTTDGTVPTAASALYSTPIPISASARIRARVFETATGAFGVITAATYEKLEANLASYSGTGVPFKSALPILVLNQYVTGEIPNDNTYRDVRMHVFDRDASGYSDIFSTPVLSAFAGAKIRGSSSASFPKKSYGIEFRGETLDSKSLAVLGMPADSDWALISCYQYDPAFMRNAWVYEAYRRAGRWAPRTRLVEVFFNQDGNNLDYADYRGVYLLCETVRKGPSRLDITGIEPSDVTQPGLSGGYIFKVDRSETDEYWWKTNRSLPPLDALIIHRPKLADLPTVQSTYMRNYFQSFEDAVFTEASAGFTTRNYRNYIDSKTWVDHNIFDAFPKNVDALRLSAYFFKDRGRRMEGGPVWDFDRSADSTDGRDDAYNTWVGTGDSTNYFTYAWWQPLFQDIEFRQLFVDRWQELRTGPLSTASFQGIINGYLSEFKTTDADNPASRDYARWSVSRNFPNEVTNLRTWLTNRAAWVDSQFTLPPVVLTPPGVVAAGSTVSFGIPAGTTVYYRLDGQDPRLEGGGVRSGTSVYTGTPITLNSTKMIFARAWRSGSYSTPSTNWSGPVKPLYLIDEAHASSANLKVTAIHYNPLDVVASESASIPDIAASDFEWIELGNSSAGPVNLEGVSLAAGEPVSAVVLPAFTLAPGERAVIVKRREAFLLRYPGMASRIVAEWTGDRNLANDGDTVHVLDRSGADIALFDYNDSSSWPSRADGWGAALQYEGAGVSTSDYETGANWRSSAEIGGTPGSPGTGPRNRVIINEILTESTLPQVDAIELFNPGTAAIDLSGWFLCNADGVSSADDYRKFRIPNGTILQAGAHLVFTEQDFNPNGSWNPLPSGPEEWEFSLDGARGGNVWLVSADPVTAVLDAFEDRAEFDPSISGVSIGRPMDQGDVLLPLNTVTLFDDASVLSPLPASGAVNSAVRNGQVQVSEIMYHPVSGWREYIELVNTSGTPVSLDGWTLRGDVDMYFTAAHVLAAGECVLLVGFDPVVETSVATQFRSLYQIPVGISLWGPWSSGDSLGNSAGEVRLRRKVPPPVDEPLFVGLMVEDEVIYSAFSPWPSGASGTGSAIHRLGILKDGNDPSSWIVATASAGSEAGGIEGWNRFHFPGGGASSDPMADGDHDGLPNRIEYLLGRDPGVSDGTPWSVITRAELTGDFLFEYRRRRDRDDLPLVPRQSGDLQHWINAPHDEHVGYDGWFEIRQVRIPVVGPRDFLRLESPVED